MCLPRFSAPFSRCFFPWFSPLAFVCGVTAEPHVEERGRSTRRGGFRRQVWARRQHRPHPLPEHEPCSMLGAFCVPGADRQALPGPRPDAEEARVGHAARVRAHCWRIHGWCSPGVIRANSRSPGALVWRALVPLRPPDTEPASLGTGEGQAALGSAARLGGSVQRGGGQALCLLTTAPTGMGSASGVPCGGQCSAVWLLGRGRWRPPGPVATRE